MGVRRVIYDLDSEMTRCLIRIRLRSLRVRRVIGGAQGHYELVYSVSFLGTVCLGKQEGVVVSEGDTRH